MSISRSLKTVVLSLVVMCLPAAVPSASTQPSGIGSLTIASIVTEPGPTIVVEGTRFSPGALVSIVIYDLWGSQVYESVWTTASTGHHSSESSADPALWTLEPGSISESIVLFPATIFGPNGSQDPAQGYVRGADADPALSSDDGAGCGRDLMVRAYDAQADAWSNAVDVVPAC